MLCAALPAVPSPLRSIFPGPCLMQHACALFASFWVCCNEGSLCARQAAVDSLVPQGRQIPVSHCPYLPCDSFHLQEDGRRRAAGAGTLVSPAIPFPLPFSQQTCCLPGRNRRNKQQSGKEGRIDFVQQLLARCLSCLTAAAFLGQQVTVALPVWLGAADILLDRALSSRYI